MQQKGINSLINFPDLNPVGSFENNCVLTISNIVAAPSFLFSIVLAMTEQ